MTTDRINSDGPVADDGLSEEDANLVDGILNELRDDPPLQCEVQFVMSAGDEEHAQRVTQLMRANAVMLRRSNPDLDFRALRRVTFHADYDLALHEAAERVGRPVSPTREPGGFGFAMVIPADDHCELVADARLADGLLSEDPGVRDFHLNVLRHELAHVADCTRHQKVWADEWMSAKITGLRRHFFPMAHSVWSEYYANRVSDGVLGKHFLVDEEEMLAGALNDAANSINAQIASYRWSHDLEALRQLAESKLAFVALTLGYVLGHHAARALAGPIAQELQMELRKGNLESAFDQFGRELDRLYLERWDWRSTTCMNALEQLWREVMAAFGLYYEELDGEGVYIRVP